MVKVLLGDLDCISFGVLKALDWIGLGVRVTGTALVFVFVELIQQPAKMMVRTYWTYAI